MIEGKFIIDSIVCDETNNTQKDIDNGTINVDIYAHIEIVLVDPVDKLIEEARERSYER